eukprot:5913806-Pyramimonas_sp.AAC.1
MEVRSAVRHPPWSHVDPCIVWRKNIATNVPTNMSLCIVRAQTYIAGDTQCLPMSLHSVHRVTGLGECAVGLGEHCERLAAKSKDTFWLGAEDTPRCPLEALARSVFAHHVPAGAAIDMATSGVEWWTQ